MAFSYPANAATDGDVSNPSFPEKFKVISQAPAGKLGVMQLGIMEKKKRISVEDFRTEATRRAGTSLLMYQ